MTRRTFLHWAAGGLMSCSARLTEQFRRAAVYVDKILRGARPATLPVESPGQYELVFGAGDYFAAQGVDLPSPRFIDQVTIAFGIADAGQNYHVPLVVSPWSYSTYRGS